MAADPATRQTRGADSDRPPRPGVRTLSRNLNELLQEIRVTQTGVQILTGFLLTVPFSARFEALTADQRVAYVAVLVGSIITTGFVVTPVAIHRVLFRQRRRLLIVETSHKMAVAGLMSMALTVAGVLALCLDITMGRGAALVGLAGSVLGFAALWLALPLVLKHRGNYPLNELPEKDPTDKPWLHE